MVPLVRFGHSLGVERFGQSLFSAWMVSDGSSRKGLPCSRKARLWFLQKNRSGGFGFAFSF